MLTHSSLAKIVDLEFWVVGALAVGSLVFNPLLPLAVLVAAVFWILRFTSTRKLTHRTPADWSILFLVLTILPTLWAAQFQEVSIQQVLRMLVGIFLFYAIVSWAQNTRRLILFWAGTWIAGLFLAVFSVFSVEWSSEKLLILPARLFERFQVLVSDTVNPNVLAGSLVILAPLPLAAILFHWKGMTWFSRLIAILAMLALSGMLLLTGTRGAWLAYSLAILVLVALRWRWGWIILAASLAGAGLLLFTYQQSYQTFRIIGGFLGTFNNRIDIWQRAIFLIQSFPYTGIGMGTFTEKVALFFPFPPDTTIIIPHAHNLFLQIAVDLGIPGLIAWLAVWSGVIASAWRLYRVGWKYRIGLAGGLGAAILASQAALAVHGLTDAVTWGMVRPAPLVWVLWGIAISGWLTFSRKDTERLNQEKNSL